MTDKLRRTHPLNITFAEGESPTGPKLTAVASQARVGARVLEKAVGDLWNQSGDPILTDWPLQLPNLARMVGENKWLNPLIFPVTQTFTYTDRIGARNVNNNDGYLQFLPVSATAVARVTGSALVTNIGSDIGNVLDDGDFWVDSSTGRVKSFTEMSASDVVTYTVDPSTWAITNSTVPGVIPDSRQAEFTGCRISSDGSNFFIHLPPRRPLTLTGNDRPERYPPTGDISSNEATTISPYKLWQSGSIAALADAHYRYYMPKELADILSTLSAGASIPDGFLYLWDQNTNTIVEDATFTKSSLGNWIFGVSATSQDLNAKVTTNENPSSYNSTGYSIITCGSPIARTIFSLSKAIYGGTHDNSGDFTPVLSHSALVGLNPPMVDYAGHNGRYPDTVPSWAPSFWAMDDHVSLLSRAGSQGTGSDFQRDVNDNAMLGDLLIGSTIIANDINLGVPNQLNIEHDSYRLYFGKKDSTTAANIFSVWDSEVGAVSLRLETPNNGYIVIYNGSTGVQINGGQISANVLFLNSLNTTKALTVQGVGSAAPLRIVVDNANPSSNKAAGDMFMVTPGKLRTYNGSAWERVVTLANSNTAASTAVTAAAETEFDQTYVIPANTLNAGSVIRLYATGLTTTNGSSMNLTIKARIGTGAVGSRVLLASSQTVNAPGANTNWVVDLVAIVRTAGVSGTVIAGGTISSTQAGLITGGMTTTGTIDTSVANTLSITGTWSATTGSPSTRLDIIRVDVQ